MNKKRNMCPECLCLRLSNGKCVNYTCPKDKSDDWFNDKRVRLKSSSLFGPKIGKLYPHKSKSFYKILITDDNKDFLIYTGDIDYIYEE